VRRGDSDIGITFGVDSDPEFSAVLLSAEPLIYCARRELFAAARDTARLQDLSALPLALPSKDFGIRILLDQACLASGIVLDPILSSNSFEILRDFAATGGGGAVLPQRALRGKETDALRAVKISDKYLRPTYVEIIALRSRRLPRIVKLFLSDLGRAVAE
jgi:DNA-binding transcriptional LysR family regulator